MTMSKHKIAVNAWACLVLALCMSVSTAAYADWGAIATDDPIGDTSPPYGVGGGASKGEATKNAVKFCRESGGKKCEVVVSYQKCGAYASSRSYSGAGIGATEAAARKAALAECNHSSCKILVADCN